MLKFWCLTVGLGVAQRLRIVVLALVLILSLPEWTRPAGAEPTTNQVLADIGVSADDRERVMNGEFVMPRLSGVSERDLPVALVVFLVKTSPDALASQIMAGDFITADPQVQAHGRFSHPGSLADLAGVKIPKDVAQRLSSAQAGHAVNLATSEINAFKALQSDEPSVRAQLQRMLLARYQAYRASGLEGITPYDRGSGRTTDLAADMRKASQSTALFEKYMPAFHRVLLGYPQATVPGMRQDFRWVSYSIENKPTYVLVHMLSAADGAARAIVQRHYYVSTGYNGQQAVAGFLPVRGGGTLVVYAGHAFTDQVAGLGGAIKRGIGRRIMADKIRQIFEAGRTRLAE
jgi:hypothetical protein